MSELYASLLMIGVTISLGGLVSAAAMGQLTQTAGQNSLGASLGLRGADTLLTVAYASVPSSASCPQYLGRAEGTTLVLAVYDYGSEGFSPVIISVNSTAHPGNYASVAPGSMTTYDLQLGGCAHEGGQSILLSDPGGEVFRFES